MARQLDRQEILITPEGKAKRCLPTERGRRINVSGLIARRQVGLKQTNLLPSGHFDPPAHYTARKQEAQTTRLAIRDPRHLQVDENRFDQATVEPGLQLKTVFAGLDDTEYAPPDCQMAAGPDHLVVAVNASWAVFDKTGRQLLRRNFADLFEPLADNPLISRPRVVYDQFRGAWVMGACAISQDFKRSWFFLAASHGGDPLGEWWIWAIDSRSDESQANLHPDSLGLAVDQNSVYLTANMFAGQGQFSYARLRIIAKTDLINGGMLHGWDFWQLKNYDGTPCFGLEPALNLRAPEAQFLINATNDGHGLTLWKVTQRPRQAPTLSRKFMPTVPFQLAPGARQQKIEAEIETGDTRICQPVYRHGQIWVAHSVAVNWRGEENVAAIQWFQINPKAGYVINQGVFGAPDYHYFCPAVTVDQSGNMVMVFNRVGENDPPAICYTARFVTDTVEGLRRSAELLQSSMAGACQWSTTSAAAMAPEGDLLWMMGQYVATENDWATWIGAIAPGLETQPSPAT